MAEPPFPLEVTGTPTIAEKGADSRRTPTEPDETSTSSSTLHGRAPLSAFEQQRAVEQAEHVANLIRLRKGMMFGAILWPTFVVVDLVVDSMVQPGILGTLAAIRFGLWPVLLVGTVVLFRRKGLSPRATRAVELGLFVIASSALALMCVFFRGFASIYFGGIILVLLCRGAFVVERWRENVLHHVLIAGAYPAVLFASTLFSGKTAAQLANPEAMGTFIVCLSFVISASAFTVLSSHVMWALRRQVFEARNIGRYRLESRIGKGGMGEVWSAYDRNLKRNVALKILRVRDGQDQTGVARFEREVKATSELAHPNTVRVFDYGVSEDGLWYYAMELLEGEPLGRIIRKEGPLSIQRAIHIVSQTARALAEAHAAGIVHRDIKPDNIFVTSLGGERDFVKLLDFGIARMTEGTEASLTLTGQLAGTPSYISPEVAAGKPADARSDVYAMGAVLYSALTGCPPFVGKNASAILFCHLHERPVPPSERLGASVPEDVEGIVMRCLEKDPANRFANAQELAMALAEASLTGAETTRDQEVEPRVEEDEEPSDAGSDRVAKGQRD